MQIKTKPVPKRGTKPPLATSPPLASKLPPLPISKDVKTEVMTITPEMATRWLEGNTHNRPLRQRDVDKFAKAMGNGWWALNGESIIFASDGRLMDGQHRLWACVESGTPFQSIVVHGVPLEFFTTIDQGRVRSHADHLHVAKVEAPPGALKSIAAVASIVIRYRTNNIFLNTGVPPAQVLTLVENEPGIIEWVELFRRTPIGLKGFATPLAATLHIGGAGKYREQALLYASRWATGADLVSGSPILTLRQRVLSKNLPNSQIDRFFMAVSSWNAFAQQRALLKIVGTIRSDKFPNIVGAEPTP